MDVVLAERLSNQSSIPWKPEEFCVKHLLHDGSLTVALSCVWQDQAG
jgi:hypothetical protein